MSIEELKNEICNEDIVCLYAEEVDGFLFAHQSSSAYNIVSVRAKDDRNQPRIPDSQTICFRIRNANRYKLQKAYAKLENKLNADPKDMKLKAEVAAAKVAASAEVEDNDAEQKRQLGKRIVYGQIIQLEHKFTGKLLHASSRNTAITESSNMRVFLSAVNDKTAHFRIMPRYKVKAEGDLIQVDDQIVLESVKSLGQYLHVSRGVLGNLCPIYASSHELNLSVRSSGFSIYRHCKWKDLEEGLLRAGAPFRLFHAELEAYLVASGVFGSDVTEEVHLRVRNLDPNQPRTMVPPTSAITYWQLEFYEGAVKGDVVKWQQQVRIKHMCTQRYLSVDKNQKVGLTNDHLDPLTVFKLHPVIKSQDGIDADTFCRISHVVTGLWLSGKKEEFRGSSDHQTKGDNSSMESLRWSTAVQKQIVVTEEMQYDDAFTIQPVEAKNLVNFNFMAGTVPIIQMMIEMASSKSSVNPQEEDRILKTMGEIRDFMLVNSEPCKNRQKLLRNLQVVELLVQLLQRPIRGSPNVRFLTKIFLEAYDVLHAYLLGNSRKNELYMARHIEFFKNQISIEGEVGLNAAYMVTELVRDNRKLVDRIPQSYIDDIVSILMIRKHERYLEFLEILCVCDGMNIPDNQRYICDKWLMSKGKSCVFHTDVGQAIGKEKDIVYVSTDNKRTWTTLRKFANEYKTALLQGDKEKGDIDRQQQIFGKRGRAQASKPSTNEAKIRDFRFLDNQLQLFGRNYFCINVITQKLGYLTWEEAFLCLTDAQIPDEVRAKYCEVIINLFIDVGDHVSVLDRIKLTFVYDEIPDREKCSDPDVAVKNAANTHEDPDAERHIAMIRQWIAKFLDDHKDMTASLVGENNLITQVLRLLQYLVRFGYYNQVSDLLTLIGPLLSLTDGRNDKPCPPTASGGGKSEFKRVKEYYQTHERYRPSSEAKAIVDAKMEAMEVLVLLFNYRFNLRLLRFISEFKHVHHTAQQMHGSSDLVPLLDENYDIDNSSSTNQKARRILEDMLAESDYFANTQLVDIIMDLSNYEYDQMVTNSMWLLHRNFSAHDMLFKRAVTAQVLITDDSIKVYHMLEENIPVLRRLVTSRMSEAQTEVMIRILDELTSVCYLENNPMEPHPMNQTILYNSGLVQNLLDLVTQAVDPQILSQNTGLRTVIEKSFTLLRLLAVANDVVQQRLFDRLDSLLNVKGAETYLAEALTEVFTGNKDTCMRIYAPQIRTIMDLVAKHTHESPQFLDLLNAVVKVEELNLPLKRNQTYVMTYFMQLRSEIAYPLDVDVKTLIEKFSGNSRKNDVVYIILLVNLLATCAEGENRYIESINQTIFKVEDLIHIINNPAICNQYKKSFMRFLLWVYLNTAGGLAESGAAGISHDGEVWKLMDTLTQEVKDTTEFAKANPNVVRMLLRKEPTTREVLNSDKSAVREIHETLFYYLDGVFPFIQVFFQTCFEKDMNEHPSEMTSLNALATNLLELSDVLIPMVDNANDLERIAGAIRSILSVSTLPQTMIEDFQDKCKRIQIQEIESEERKMYNEAFSAEEDLNRQLNVFAVNYSVVYGGLNTISAQIGGSTQDKMADEEYTDLGSDVELPLGKEFQSHITCFIDESAENVHRKYIKAEKLVQQLKISSSRVLMNENMKQEQEELDIKCLQILRGIVHNTRIRLPNEDDSVDTMSKSYQSRMELLRQVQVAINSHKTVLHVLPLLSKPSDSIVREVLAFLVDMLFGGNVSVQASFYEYFIGTREERFFFAIRNRMQLSSIAYKEKRSLMAQHQAKIDEAKEQMKNLQRAMEAGDKIVAAIQLHKIKNSTVHLSNGSAVSMKNRLLKLKQSSSIRGSKLSIKSSTASFTTLSVPSPPPRLSKVHPIEEKSNDMKLEEMRDSVQIEEVEQTIMTSEVDLTFKDDGYIELVLRVMAYMCDGQNKNIQDYLREQPDNIKSVNLIADVVKFLSVIYTNINPNSLGLLIQVFDTMVEFGSGNQANQAVIYENKVCDFINFILRSQKQVSQCDLNGEYSLKLSIGQLIFVLIEENVCEVSNMEATLEDVNSNNVANNMMLSLDADIIKNTFVRVYQTIQEERKLSTISPDNMELITTVGFRYFHILLRLIDLDYSKTKVTKEKCIREDTPDEVAAWAFYDGQTKSVEILKDDVLQKVYFHVKDESILRNEVKDMFKYEVDRSSPSTKLRDLLSWSKEIIEDIKYQRKITSNWIGVFLVRGWFLFNIVAILLSVAIAVVILSSWKEDTTSDYAIVPIRDNWSFYTVLVLGILHNVFSFLILLSFFLSNHVRPPNLARYKRKLKSIFTCGLASSEKKTKSKGGNNLGIDLISFSTFYYVIFFGLSIGGSFTYGYLFAFHMLHIAGFNQMLKRVIQAVTRNGMSLIWVGLYSLTIFYIYGLISFAFFRGQLLETDGNYCNEMWQCFITVIHRGLVFGLHDGSNVNIPSGSSYSWYLGKFFFDVTAFIIITTIGLNIIFGIIVDTFSELRDSKWNVDNDIATQCFICSRSSHDFEHHPGGFDIHRRIEHNEWSYLFYFIHLDETQHNDYTGLEMYVAGLFLKDQISFFPIRRSLSLQVAEEDDMEMKIDNLLGQMDFLISKKKEREASKAREEEIKRQLEWEKMHRSGAKSPK